MTVLYSCRVEGSRYRITKFDTDLNVESSYLCTLSECECPAGVRPTCRHRDMLPKFLHRERVDTNWFYDYDRGGWVQGWLDLSDPKTQIDPKPEPLDLSEASRSCLPPANWRRGF